MHLNLFLALLHGHLELVLAILKTVHLVGLHINSVTQLLDFELHDVMLNQSLLLLVGHFSKLYNKHIVFDNDVLEGRRERILLSLDFLN
jgi:hypothetical protein